MAISFGHGELQGEVVRILRELDARMSALETKAAVPAATKAAAPDLMARVVALEAKAAQAPPAAQPNATAQTETKPPAEAKS